MGSINRRTFVLGSAGIGASVLAGGLLGSCSAGGSVSDSLADDEGVAADVQQESEVPSGADAVEEPAPTQAEEASEPVGDAVPVYFTSDISPQGLMAVWNALKFKPEGNVAIKISTGEPGGQNFLQPALIADLVQSVEGTIVECNTAYGGARSSTESHMQAAADHGFTAIAEVDIMDGDGEMSIPVTGGTHLSEDIVGANLANYQSVIVLSHFKGHAMGGFGGALKNTSIGVASSSGKLHIHSAGASKTSWQSAAQDDFLESMAEAAKAVSDYVGADNMVYVNVMNNLSVDCDCDSHPAPPDMADIGILASRNPVALDRACVDLVYAAADGASLIRRMESKNGAHILEHAEAIGLGDQAYQLIDIG